MTAQIIIIGLAFCFGMASGGYLVYFLINHEKAQQPFETFEDYMDRVKYEYISPIDFENPHHNGKIEHLTKQEILDKFGVDIAKTCEILEEPKIKYSATDVASLDNNSNDGLKEPSFLKTLREIEDSEIAKLPNNFVDMADVTITVERPNPQDFALALSKFDYDFYKTFQESDSDFWGRMANNKFRAEMNEAALKYPHLKHYNSNRPPMDYFSKSANHEPFPLDKNGNDGC